MRLELPEAKIAVPSIFCRRSNDHFAKSLVRQEKAAGATCRDDSFGETESTLPRSLDSPCI